MKQINFKGEWVRSSSTPKRSERLKAHEEFEASELKKRLDEGFHITGAKVKPKRPRIHKDCEPKMVITIVFGKETKVGIHDYNTHYKPCGFKAIKFIF